MTTVNPKQTTTYALNAATSVTFGAKTNIDVSAANTNGIYGAATSDWSVTNLGSISGSSAVFFAGDGTFVNGVTGKIVNPTGVNSGVHIAGSGSVTNAGSIVHSSANGGATSAISINGSGTIVNKASGTVVGNVYLGGSGTVTNKGSISNSGEHVSDITVDGGGTATNSGTLDMVSGQHISGIFLGSGGTATNTGKIIGGAIYMSGLFSEAGGTLTNNGKIKLSSSDHVAGIEANAGGSIDNTGIVKVSVSAGHTAGIELDAGGTVTNSGAVTMTSPSHGSGVDFKNGGTLVNLAGGVITALGPVGVYANGSTGVSVTNAGTISGRDSIDFNNAGTSSAAITNTLTLQSGSDLIGQALGSTGAFVTNDLVFEGTGIASNKFADFQSLTVDAGANWKISGSAGIAETTVHGTLKVTATGSLTGPTTIEGGTAIFKAAYEGGVTFAGAGELELGNSYTGVISGLGASDNIDLLNLTFAKGDHAVVSGDVLSIETASSKSLATLTLDNSTYSASNFAVGKDAAGHVLVSYA